MHIFRRQSSSFLKSQSPSILWLLQSTWIPSCQLGKREREKVYLGQSWMWSATFCWQEFCWHEFSHKVTPSCKEGWDIESSYVSRRKRKWVWWMLCQSLPHSSKEKYVNLDPHVRNKVSLRAHEGLLSSNYRWLLPQLSPLQPTAIWNILPWGGFRYLIWYCHSYIVLSFCIKPHGSINTNRELGV